MMDLVRICHRFYDHPFDLTMRWKLNRDSNSIIDERSIRLTDAQQINCKNWTPSKVMQWIRKTFLISFGMEQVMEDSTIWKSSSNISCSVGSEPFKVAPYPKNMDIFMDFSRIKCFDAKDQGQKQRITFLKGNPLSFVKYRVKTRLGIAEDVLVDRIRLCVDDRVIESEDDMEKYLLPDHCIVLCHVSTNDDPFR